MKISLTLTDKLSWAFFESKPRVKDLLEKLEISEATLQILQSETAERIIVNGKDNSFVEYLLCFEPANVELLGLNATALKNLQDATGVVKEHAKANKRIYWSYATSAVNMNEKQVDFSIKQDLYSMIQNSIGSLSLSDKSEFCEKLNSQTPSEEYFSIDPAIIMYTFRSFPPQLKIV